MLEVGELGDVAGGGMGVCVLGVHQLICINLSRKRRKKNNRTSSRMRASPRGRGSVATPDVGSSSSSPPSSSLVGRTFSGWEPSAPR